MHSEAAQAAPATRKGAEVKTKAPPGQRGESRRGHRRRHI
jgi:hypothetical protein